MLNHLDSNPEHCVRERLMLEHARTVIRVVLGPRPFLLLVSFNLHDREIVICVNANVGSNAEPFFDDFVGRKVVRVFFQGPRCRESERTSGSDR